MLTMETATREDWTETNNRLAGATPRAIIEWAVEAD